MTLKAPLLFQFPYCKLSDNNYRRSNYRLMNVLFCTRTLLPNFEQILKVINDRRKKRYDFPIDFAPT